MKSSIISLAIAAGLTFGAAATANASVITGTYTTAGDTSGSGPWTMTSTDGTFSILRFVFDTPVKFEDLLSLSVAYNAVLGGIGGGSPRIALVMDFDGDNVADGSVEINWGPPGSFSDPTLGAGNTGNLLALTDLGRYDNTDVGGLFYSDRAAALALAGSYYVLRASIILDSFGGNDREFEISGVSAAAVDAVPEPQTLALLIVGLLGLVMASRRGRSPRGI